MFGPTLGPAGVRARRSRPFVRWLVLLPVRSCAPLALLIALFAAPAATAQEASWRSEVDTLVDRWADDVGSSRIERARAVIERHLVRFPDDAEALLEKARLTLALEPDPTSPPRIQADQARTFCKEAQLAADRAAELLSDDRKGAALALGFLAARQGLDAELSRMRISGADDPAAQRLVTDRGADMQGRHRRLQEARGDVPADELLRVERERLDTLRHVDRLGSYPRPIGIHDVAGEPVDLTAYHGKVLLVLFWSSEVGECGPLLAEVQQLYADLHDKGLEVLAISCDKERATFDAATAGLPWRHCFEGKGLLSSVAQAWSVRALPDGALIDHSGRVRYLRPWRWGLRLAIEDLLERRDRSS